MVRNVILGREEINPYFRGYYGENGCSFGPFSLDFLIDKMNKSDRNCLVTGITYIRAVDMEGNEVFIERER